MNKIIYRLSLVAVAVSTLALTGCKDFSSPGGVVKTAYQALGKNDTVAFPKTLRDQALKEYGDLAGMIDLQKRLGGLSLRVGNESLVSSEKDSLGRDKKRTFEVKVLGRPTENKDAPYVESLAATVVCDVRYHWVDRGPYYPGPGFGCSPYASPWACYPGTPVTIYPGNSGQQESQYCLISEIH